MKKLLSFLMALGFILGVAACEPQSANNEADESETLEENAEELGTDLEEEVDEEDPLENEDLNQ